VKVRLIDHKDGSRPRFSRQQACGREQRGKHYDQSTSPAQHDNHGMDQMLKNIARDYDVKHTACCDPPAVSSK
jgi:hypothetical protein